MWLWWDRIGQNGAMKVRAGNGTSDERQRSSHEGRSLVILDRM